MSDIKVTHAKKGSRPVGVGKASSAADASPVRSGAAWSPFDFLTKITAPSTCRMDMYEKDNTLYLSADVAGYKKDQIKLRVDGDLLTISATPEVAEFKEEDYCFRERSVGAFSRTVRLPTSVDPTHIQAKYENGCLNLTMPLHYVGDIQIQ